MKKSNDFIRKTLVTQRKKKKKVLNKGNKFPMNLEEENSKAGLAYSAPNITLLSRAS